jgi:hypothetical protein
MENIISGYGRRYIMPLKDLVFSIKMATFAVQRKSEA